MNIIQIILAFIAVGITLEVFWTSIINSIKSKDRKLTGKTYLWMFPIYAFVPYIYIFGMRYMQDINIFIKAFIYMFAFYLLEFSTGYIIRKIVGVSPWNYRGYNINIFKNKYRANYKGLICLEYAPVWYLYGIMGEYFIKFLMELH